LAKQGFIGEGTPPKLTDEVRVEAAKRYIDEMGSHRWDAEAKALTEILIIHVKPYYD